jgi:ATP-dependent Clp protease ATP-binding subunit ClpA
MELWQKFTGNARQSVLRAHDRARQQETCLISPAHLLLGLVAIGRGEACERLQTLPDLPGLIEQCEALAAESPPGDPENVTFTPEAQRAITRAYLTAKEEGSENIGTRHLLAGLMQESSLRDLLRDAGMNNV